MAKQKTTGTLASLDAIQPSECRAESEKVREAPTRVKFWPLTEPARIREIEIVPVE